ncbi:MAG: alpha/beta fold hydrolase [Rhizomicrobium sp.]
MLDRLTAPWLDRSNYPLDWNGPVARAATTQIDLGQPIFELFAKAASRHPDRIALDDGARSLSYAETLAAARALAQRIASETAQGDLVGILLPSCCDFSVAMLACLAAGRLFVPLDSHYPQAWLAGVVKDCGMAAVIGRFDDAETDQLVPQGVRRIDLGESKISPAVPFAPVGPDAPAFVLFTSGSTGKPKGIVNSQRALLRRVAQYAEAAHIDETDRFLPLSSECTIAGLRERFTALLSGATLHLIDVQRAGARAILDRLAGVTLVYAVPALLRSLTPLGAAPSSLRVLRVGGEAVLWSDIDALRAWLPPDCRIELGYSSTEAPIMQWFVPADFPREGERVPLGYPLAGNALAVVGESGEAATPGDAGELVLRSPYVALGRWVDGKVDAGDFPADPNDPSCRIHRTGDLVCLRADGLIDLVGRKDRQIKIRGVRVEPGELEAAIRRRPGIRDVAVYPRRVGAQWWLIAYVVGNSVGLKAALRDSLPAALQPQRIHCIDAIPRLASAKLDRTALAALDEDRQRQEVECAAPASAAPLGKTEETVAAIWRRVLKRDRIGRDDDFFDCGGDSLSTLELMFALEEALAVRLPVTAIYAAPTIARLAAAIDDRRVAEFSPLVPIKDGMGIPLFIVHGLGGNVMELFAAGRRIAGDAPVYAIQARGVDGRETPATAIAAMADDYIAEILKLCPHGAFHLAGYSSGGLIAFEMARLLARAGEPPASLTLIDAQTSAENWPFAVWLGLLSRRAAHHARALRAIPTGERLRYARTAALSFGHKLLLRLGLEQAAAEQVPGLRIPSALQAVADATTIAIAHYAPGFYNGPVHLIVPRIPDPQRPDPALLWRDRCAAMTVSVVPGDHRSMVRGENAARLAAVLSEVVAV